MADKIKGQFDLFDALDLRGGAPFQPAAAKTVDPRRAEQPPVKYADETWDCSSLQDLDAKQPASELRLHIPLYTMPPSPTEPPTSLLSSVTFILLEFILLSCFAYTTPTSPPAIALFLLALSFILFSFNLICLPAPFPLPCASTRARVHAHTFERRSNHSALNAMGA